MIAELLKPEQKLGFTRFSHRPFVLTAAGRGLCWLAREGFEPLDARVKKLPPSLVLRNHAGGRGGVGSG